MRALALVLVVVTLLAGCSDDASDDTSDDTITVTMPAGSMEPTIKIGERVILDKVDGDYEPTRGEIVLFQDPGGWLYGGGGEGELLKRVIGVPGDTVVCCDGSGRLVINGEPLDEPYIANAPSLGRRHFCAASAQGGGCHWQAGPVPDDRVFVLGDNRTQSADSRFHMCGPRANACDKDPYVPFDLIRGRAGRVSSPA